MIKNIAAKSNKSIITAKAEAPEQVQLGVHIIRDDLKSTREEADVIISYQVSEVIAEGKKSLKSPLLRLEELKNKSLYDQLHGRKKHPLGTVKKHKVLIPGLVSVYAKSGCDTVPIYYGIGNEKALNVATS